MDESAGVIDDAEHGDRSIQDGAMILTVRMVDHFSGRLVSVTMQLSTKSEVTLNVKSGIWADPCDVEALVGPQTEEKPTTLEDSEVVPNDAAAVETCANSSPEDLDGK